MPERPEQPHDILAAEAFALGEGDRELHREPAHDVLAADEFALPSADGRRPHLPPDEHSDDPQAHDVLSAEEYAMPAGGHHSLPPGYATGSAAPRRRFGGAPVAVGALLALLVWRRRR